MSLDPYPDLPDTAMGTGAEPVEQEPVAELSEADSRLLRALSQHAPPVVRAVEDDPRTVFAGRGPSRPASRSSSLAPVFRAPPD